MKIYTRVEYVWDKDLQEYVEVSSDSYEYDGPVAQAGGGSSSSQETTTTTEPPDYAQPYLENVLSQANQYLNAGSQNTTAAPSIYNEAIRQYGQAADALNPYINNVRAANEMMASGSLLTPDANPAFQQYLDLSNQAITRQLNEGILPNLDIGALSSGNFGTTRQGIGQGLAAGRTIDAIARNTAGLTDAAYGRGLTATLGAQSLAPQLGQLSLLPAQTTQLTGDLTDIAGNYADRLNLDRLNAYANLVNQGTYGQTQTSIGPETQTGGLTGALGGGMAGAGIAAALPASMAAWNPYIIGAGALAGYLS